MFGFVGDVGPGAAEALGAHLNAVAGPARARMAGEGFLIAADTVHERPDIGVALTGRPHWCAGATGPASAGQIAEAYLARGEAALADLGGGFAVAVVDRRSGRVVVAIDRMGIAGLAWAPEHDGVVFSTSARAVARRPGRIPSIRSQALYDYFFFHMVPAPFSVFEGVSKLPAASALRWDHGAVEVSAYWRPNLERPSRGNPTEYGEALHAALAAAVRDCRPDAQTGAFLSGGLDSSTVAGVLSRQQNPADTFSIGFGVPEFDELPYARIASAHFGCRAHEYVVTPQDVVEAIPVVAQSYDEPFGNSSAIPTYLCARFARDGGMTRLLAGDGGDELFGGNERYARQKVFEWYAALPAGLRSPLTAVVRAMSKPDGPIMPLRKLRSYVDQASIPLPDRLESWNYVYREGAEIMFEPDFAAALAREGPLEHMREVFQAAEGIDLLDRMLIYDWKFTLADNDLRKVTTMCAAAGIDVDFPMLDNRVVDLSLRVPSRMKLPGLSLRHFYKRAMRGFLPDATLKKSKHGFGLPFGVWLKSHQGLADLVYGSLSDLKARGVVRAGFLDELIEAHRAGHPGYFGYIIWDLVILEEWLKHNAS
jgi:asparagine synthase (glutamine-hydrolysing)